MAESAGQRTVKVPNRYTNATETRTNSIPTNMSVNSPNQNSGLLIPEKTEEAGENEIQQVMKFLKKSNAEQQKSNQDLKKMIQQASVEQTSRLAAFQAEMTAQRKECMKQWQETDVRVHLLEEAKVANDHYITEQTAVNMAVAERLNVIEARCEQLRITNSLILLSFFE